MDFISYAFFPNNRDKFGHKASKWIIYFLNSKEEDNSTAKNCLILSI